MPNNYRIEKVSALLKKELTLIFLNDLEDDLTSSYFVNISKIELTGDLQYCKVHISATADQEIKKQIVENLNHKKSFIKHKLSQRVEMRRMPEIMFKEDKVIEKGLSVLKVLEELRNKKAENSCGENNESN